MFMGRNIDGEEIEVKNKTKNKRELEERQRKITIQSI